MPHRLGSSKLQQRHPIHPVDTAGVELGRPADSVEIHGAVLLESGERLPSHTALPDHRAYAVFSDDAGLIRLLANARRRARGGDLPSAIRLLRHDRAAVIDDAAVEI